MRYLVTGGCGFIGSHLCTRLLDAGHEVVVIDDLSTGRFDNIEAIHQHTGFRLIVGSVLEHDLMDGLIRDCDAVFHLASAVGVKLIMEQPVQTISTIFQGTDVVLKLAARYRKRVLLTSTSEVYGKSENVPFHEDGDRLEGPTSKHRWAYACAKALDEFLALAHWKQSRLPVIVVRLFNTVGPRQSAQYGMVIPNFVRRALANEPISVYGDGQQSRCFCHVADVVEALVALIECPAAHGKVVNVGSTEEITIRGLAERIRTLTKSESEIRTVPYASVFGEGFEDMQRRIPSLDRIGELIGWKPRKSLDDILADCIADVRASAT
ncbi:MAG: GDP-mannose 4,6-dehydratase [Planctomycetaceae bacterium]|nr:GDP-mannose 4,6-dehydratase [Planctomycetaceae bacterium]